MRVPGQRIPKKTGFTPRGAVGGRSPGKW